jgi:predicted transcriptional regulator
MQSVRSVRLAASGAELQVLKVLWKTGPGTARTVKVLFWQRGQRWAHTTVLTLLQRLRSKGYVSSDKRCVPHVFRAVVSRDEMIQQQLKHLADNICEGAYGPVLACLQRELRMPQKQ